jgi:hypothetical protein
MEEVDGIEVDLNLLPLELCDCASLIRSYAVSDDVRRSERMATGPDREIEALAGLTDAQWDALNTFLDEHMERPGTPEQDVALVLSAFGEAAAEAPIELEERSNPVEAARVR